MSKKDVLAAIQAGFAGTAEAVANARAEERKRIAEYFERLSEQAEAEGGLAHFHIYRSVAEIILAMDDEETK